MTSLRHGQSYRGRVSRAYRTWIGLRARCEDPKNSQFPNYGGRGIAVCERWQTFDNFFADMGAPPAGRSIDRIDNERGYEPGNCRWATQVEQRRNTRINVVLRHDGREQCVAAWADEVGISRKTLQTRLRRGWTVAAALTREVAR